MNVVVWNLFSVCTSHHSTHGLLMVGWVIICRNSLTLSCEAMWRCLIPSTRHKQLKESHFMLSGPFVFFLEKLPKVSGSVLLGDVFENLDNSCQRVFLLFLFLGSFFGHKKFLAFVLWTGFGTHARCTATGGWLLCKLWVTRISRLYQGK